MNEALKWTKMNEAERSGTKLNEAERRWTKMNEDKLRFFMRLRWTSRASEVHLRRNWWTSRARQKTESEVRQRGKWDREGSETEREVRRRDLTCRRPTKDCLTIWHLREKFETPKSGGVPNFKFGGKTKGYTDWTFTPTCYVYVFKDQGGPISKSAVWSKGEVIQHRRETCRHPIKDNMTFSHLSERLKFHEILNDFAIFGPF